MIFYLAVCQDCHPVLPMPFYNEGERDAWVEAHRTTGHEALVGEEVHV